MVQVSHLLTLLADSQEVISLVSESLAEAGLQVVQSFDLQVARAAHSQCACPHHGTDQCDCQMSVLLIYDGGDQPVTLVIHGQDGQTHISLINDPARKFAQQLESILWGIFSSNNIVPWNQWLSSEAT